MEDAGLDDKYQYECVGGSKNLSNNYKDYLKKFAQGPCSPVLLLPGVMGTRLVVEIDCEKIREHEPLVFKSCGWNAC